MRVSQLVHCLAVTLILSLTACDDSLAPGDGMVEVTLAVTGVDGDGQVVEVSIAGASVGNLTGPGTLVATVGSGRWVVRLEGLAPNCAPVGSLARTVTVVARDTSAVTFQVECRAVTGALLVRSLTDGPDLDPTLGVRVDAGVPKTFPSNGQLLVAGLAEGPHTVVLADLNSNCTAVGSDSLTVQVEVGGLARDTAYADFQVACAGITGWLSVAVVTNGDDLDPDGYIVSFTPPLRTDVRIQSNDSLDLGRFPAGPVNLSLSGLASNCSGVGSLTRSVLVTPGSQSVVGFEVHCLGPGTLRVTTQTTGSGLDPSFDLTTDGVVSRSIGSNSVTLVDLSAGTHQVGLAGVSLQCAVSGANPRTIVIASGDTAATTFDVACVQPGTIRVGVVVTGVSLDPTYQVSVDGSASLTVPANGSVVLDVAPGTRSVHLDDVASNCSVTSANPTVVTVAQGTTIDVSFSVACEPQPRTGADITIVTTGTVIDPAYVLGLCPWGCYYYGPNQEYNVSSNGTVQLDLAPGGWEYVLQDVASNCGGAIYGGFEVVADQVTAVQIVMNCGAPATARVTASVTGMDAPTGFSLLIDGWQYVGITANLAENIQLIEGSHQFELVNVPVNCAVASANPLTVMLAGGAVTSVDFSIACTQLATLSVTASVSGVDQDLYYWVEVDGRYVGNLGPAGVVATRVAGGPHTVTLRDVDANCSVSGANPVSVTVLAGETFPVHFTVTCIENPTLQVTVATTGSNIPAQFLVGVDPDWYYGYTLTVTVGANGSAGLKLTPGTHWVTLDQVPSNCQVTSPNNVTVTLVLGSPPLPLNFAVSCQ